MWLVVACMALFSGLSPARGGAAVKSWWFVGPFSVGKTEIDGDPLSGFFEGGGMGPNVQPGNNSQLLERGVFSEFVNQGQMKWTKLATQRGVARISPQQYAVQVDLNGLVQSTSSITIQEAQGWLYGTIRAPKNSGDRVVEVHCTALHTVWIGTQYFHADMYSSGKVFASFVWEKGRREYPIKARVRYKGTLPQFSCTLRGQKARAKLFPPLPSLIPDIVDGVLTTPLVPLTVFNGGGGWLKNLQIVPAEKRSEGFTVEMETPHYAIGPSQTAMVPIRLSLATVPDAGPSGENAKCIKISVAMYASNDGGVAKERIASIDFHIRCRHGLQSHTVTYRSHDGTVTSASVIRPRRKKCGDHGCAVLLSLSGVGVEPSQQADAHKYQTRNSKASKSALAGSEWTFGLDDAWILCPGRQGAHNFEGVGHLEAAEAVHALARIVLNTEKKVDERRIIYAGHSRGGHGSLLLGVKMPDQACGIVSSNGWIRREYYADANPIFDHDVSLSHAGPFVIRSIFESSIAENDVGLTSANILDVQTTIRTCTNDGSVSPWFMRRMARILSSQKGKVELNELSKHGHWWWDTKKTNDGGALFDPYLRKRYKRAIKACGAGGARHKDDPGHSPFTVVSLNPATFHGKRGIRILRQDRTMVYSKISCAYSAESSRWRLKTINALRFAIVRGEKQRFSTLRAVKTLDVDGTPFDIDRLNGTVVFTRDRGGEGKATWRIEKDEDPALRGEEFYGPMKRVFDAPFLIVVGTLGSKAAYESNLQAAIFLANSHFAASHTHCAIVKDVDLEASEADTKNLVLIGGADNRWAANVFTAATGKAFPPLRIREKSREFVLGTCVYNSSAVAVGALLPWYTTAGTGKKLALLLAGNGVTELMSSMSYSSNVPLTRAMFTNMMPDFVVTRRADFLWKGLGGFHAAGYWGPSFDLDKRSAVVNCV
jgi:hypothetical protein